MTKETYLSELRTHLEGIPKEDILETLTDIEEHFDEGIKQDRCEDSIAAALGKPKVLASTIKMEYDIDAMSNKNSFGSNFRLVMALIGLGFTNLILLPLFLAIGLLVLSFYLVVASFYLTGGLLAAVPLINLLAPSQVHLANIPVYIWPVIGIVILFSTRKINMLLNSLAQRLYRYLLQYFKSHISIFKY